MSEPITSVSEFLEYPFNVTELEILPEIVFVYKLSCSINDSVLQIHYIVSDINREKVIHSN